MQSSNYFIIRTAVEMEPNAGDIYGVQQQQQRRMSKSNSRVRMDPHRMSVATGKKNMIHVLKQGTLKEFIELEKIW